MRTKLVEIIYHRLQVEDVDSYRNRFGSACLLIEALSKYFDVLSFKAAVFSQKLEMDNAQYQFVNKRFFKLWIPFTFHHLIKACEPDVVLIHGTFNHIQIVHLKYMLGKNCKIIVQHHGERPRGWIKRGLLKWSAKAADAYLFTSRDTALEMGISENKVKLIMEGSTELSPLEKLRCRNELKLKQSDKIYLWVGRLIPVKNPLFFLNLFHEFSSMHPEAKLFLFYHDESLLQECRAITGLSEQIIYMGKVEQSELRRWYSAADFFVSASLHEGSGYALCEAMACGCIPIVPSIGAFKFMTNDGECALMYASQDADSLKNALMTSLTCDLEANSKKVKQQFSARLSFDAIAKDLADIIEAL
jgi:glycosyltransferase involved in cell wall biosynthesis